MRTGLVLAGAEPYAVLWPKYWKWWIYHGKTSTDHVSSVKEPRTLWSVSQHNRATAHQESIELQWDGPFYSGLWVCLGRVLHVDLGIMESYRELLKMSKLKFTIRYIFPSLKWKETSRKKCQFFNYFQRNKALVIESVQFAVANKGNISLTTKKWESAVCHADISYRVHLHSFFSCWKLGGKKSFFLLAVRNTFSLCTLNNFVVGEYFLDPFSIRHYAVKYRLSISLLLMLLSLPIRISAATPNAELR